MMTETISPHVLTSFCFLFKMFRLCVEGWVSQPVVSSHHVLPQMIWQGQHWSQHLRMPGHLTPCTPRSWPQASLTQPSLTRQPRPLLQPSTPRWGTNRCVFLLSFLLFRYCVGHLWLWQYREPSDTTCRLATDHHAWISLNAWLA